ncbi:MAG: 4Fe-4S binding protein, partial [Clostridiales bacterium]|jgi:epoxyqueuosine reductase QueG|nr:4Fe-4S binding protein [Clostridiales bacterium]
VKAISATGGKWVEVDGRKEQFGYISLKHAGRIAGLGVITRNYLLTNPVYGNRLWLSAVLTDAELETDRKMDVGYCKNCDVCVKSCPTGALDNAGTVVKRACSQFFKIIEKRFVIQCFKCRTVCPFGMGSKQEVKSIDGKMLFTV